MTPTIAYIRVSTDRQANEGVSLEAQEAKIRAYAEIHDLELVAVEVEVQTAKNADNRPVLQAVLGRIQAGEADALLVVKLDRLIRRVADFGALVDGPLKGKELMSVSESIDTRTAAGRLVAHVLASVAQWERETISERTSAAMQHLRSEGRYTGGNVRYGYRVGEGGHLVERQDEQEVISFAAGMAQINRSPAAIAKELNRLGHRSRNGREFQANQVTKMLAA